MTPGSHNPDSPDSSDADAGIAAAVRLVVELQLGRDEVSLDQHLVEELNADSFDVMNIVAVLEEQHDVTITEEAASRVTTVADLVQLVADASRT